MRLRFYWLLLLSIGWPISAQPGIQEPPPAPASPATRAVVQLLAIGPGTHGNDQKCSGSGFLVNEQGAILTNAHVVYEARKCTGAGEHAKLTAKLPNAIGNTAPAVSCEVLGLDDAHDLGVLRAERPLPGTPSGGRYEFLLLDVSEITEGIPVWVAGHPLFAWRPVAQSGKFIRRDRIALWGPRGDPVEVLILSIPLQPGSSGSPVFFQDRSGVIGIVEGQALRQPAKEGQSSETIAIPVRDAVRLLNRTSVPWHPAPK